jgi:nucleotide-binding universal stress UspA family protein
VNPAAGIVCGVDHSPGARAAARVALALADRLALQALLVHVVAPPIPQHELGMAARTTDSAVVDELQRAGVDLLASVAREFAPDREIAAWIKFGQAGNVIAAVAEETRARFVVVGSRGGSAVGTLLLGSVSRRLATDGPCPTIVVPESGGTVGDGPIICAVDDSEQARYALATAAGLAERLETNLVLAHAQTEPRTSAGEELLARLVVESGLGTSVERMVLQGEPVDAIVGAATEHGAGMIVIGSRGRGALASAALGSVSSEVATRAPCPVTIVRADRTASET